MADDWKVGDLALCVDTSPRKFPQGTAVAGSRLRKGAIYTVTKVAIHPIVGLQCLWLLEEPTDSAGAYRFRKITPEEADDFDLETIELMNRKTVGETLA